jgi:acyl-CoA reductase-like NAD-dependent aldehyde dehydrogenase
MPPGEGDVADSPAGQTEAMLAGEVEQQLQKLGMTYSDWARLPGELRDQVLQAAADDVPEEYRRLVVRYFREISRRGAEAEK